MKQMKQSSSVQLSLFPCQGTSVNDAPSGNPSIARLSNYLKTSDGLCRLLMLFPGDMPLTEAIRLAPQVMCNPSAPAGKEVAL